MHTYVILSAPYDRICVEFERKKPTQHWFFYFQIARQYSKYFMTKPLNINFDDFGI